MATSWGERLEERGREAGRREGREEGREEGRLEGRQQGREEGRQEGREEGRQEGREEGRQEGLRLGRASALLEVLRAKFGPIPPDVEARVLTASEEELGRWLAQLLRADHVEDALR